MRLSFRAALAVVLCCGAGAAAAGGYVLTLDGKSSELDLDQDTAVVIDGKTVTARLQRKEQQVFRDGGLSFEHPAVVQPSTTDINAQVRQFMLVSANGNGILVQRYTGIDPAAVVDLMVSEMTDEEVAAGYTRKIEPATRQLTDGRKLSGKRVRTTSKDEAWDRYVFASGDSRSGYIVVSMMEAERAKLDATMIERVWKTLKLD